MNPIPVEVTEDVRDPKPFRALWVDTIMLPVEGMDGEPAAEPRAVVIEPDGEVHLFDLGEIKVYRQWLRDPNTAPWAWCQHPAENEA